MAFPELGADRLYHQLAMTAAVTHVGHVQRPGSPALYSYDLLDMVGLEFPNDDDGELLTAIVKGLSDQLWCRTDPYGTIPNEELAVLQERTPSPPVRNAPTPMPATPAILSPGPVVSV